MLLCDNEWLNRSYFSLSWQKNSELFRARLVVDRDWWRIFLVRRRFGWWLRFCGSSFCWRCRCRCRCSRVGWRWCGAVRGRCRRCGAARGRWCAWWYRHLAAIPWTQCGYNNAKPWQLSAFGKCLCVKFYRSVIVNCYQYKSLIINYLFADAEHLTRW